MKKSSSKLAAPDAKDFVHSKFGSLQKLIKTFTSPAHALRFGSRIHKECRPDAETREFLARLLNAAAQDDVGKSRFSSQELNLSILRFLLKDDFTVKEVPYLLQLIGNYSSARHISDCYDSEIDEIFGLPDGRLIAFLDSMLNHELPTARAAALELLEVSWGRKRLQPWITSRVADFVRDNPDRSSLEDAYLNELTSKLIDKKPATKTKSKR